MASESNQGQAQARRRENTTTEREIHYGEKERVPKMASHFESLVDRAKDSEIVTGGRVGTSTTTTTTTTTPQENRANTVGDVAVAKFQVENRPPGGDQNRPSGFAFAQGARGNQNRNVLTTEHPQPCSDQLGLGDISQLRGKAQQQSMEAINAAEQRYNYNKARESAIQGLNAASSEQTHNNQAASRATAGTQQAHDLGHTGGRGVRNQGSGTQSAQHGTQQAHEFGYTGGHGARSQGSGTQSAQQKTTGGNQAKNSSQYVGKQHYKKSEDTQSVPASKNVTGGAEERAQGARAKDTVVEGAQKTSEYLSQKTGEATESLASAGNYTWEKMVAAKDKVPTVGWSAAHYTTEKAVEGTKMAAQVVQGAGEKVVEVVAKPLLNVAKDAAVATGETLREYTARKKEEAQQRELEEKTKQSSTEQYEQGNEGREEMEKLGSCTTQQRMRDVEFEQQRSPAQPHVDVTDRMSRDSQQQKGVQFQGQEEMQTGGGVLDAIGETIVEIAQTTKNMVIGQPTQKDGTESNSII